MSEQIRCWIDADGSRYVYTEPHTAWVQTCCGDKNCSVDYQIYFTGIEDRNEMFGGREYSHAEFLRMCEGEPIADKLRELLEMPVASTSLTAQDIIDRLQQFLDDLKSGKR